MRCKLLHTFPSEALSYDTHVMHAASLFVLQHGLCQAVSVKRGGHAQDAQQDLDRAAELRPQMDGRVQQALQQLSTLRQKGQAQERQAYSGMFSKP